MNISDEKLKEILVVPGYIAQNDYNLALDKASEEKTPLQMILVREGVISDEHLGTVISNAFGFNFVNLRNESIDEALLDLIPELVVRLQYVLVFGRRAEGLKVAMSDPLDYEMQKWIEKKTGEKLFVYYATQRDILETLIKYKKELTKEFKDAIEFEVRKTSHDESGAEDVPIIKIVDMLLEYAYENDASDIHIEPLEKTTVVRYRIDGILHKVISLPKDIHDLVVTRIKVLSKLRTDEHFASQDGHFNAIIQQEGVTTDINEIEKIESGHSQDKRAKRFDVRVSVTPVTGGENIVMRLLSEKARRYSLEDLGLMDDDLETVRENADKSHGMILVTGPTGSGKTTTVYAVLKILNKLEVKISSIEDPVEYDIEGIAQIQVNPKTNLTFAKGLRAIVRQDPDIIFVGEIRDQETARVAVNSAMTGHIVLSTMHANTAATNLPRLIDMDIEPFLIASSVNVIIAQRLVRRICLKCRQSFDMDVSALEGKLDKKILEKYSKNKKTLTCFRGEGCASCHNIGYSGRTGIFEVMEITDEVRELIMNKADARQIEQQAVKGGMRLMVEDGIRKVLNGVTTMEEVMRVTSE